MKRIILKDVTFIFPVKIDAEERIKNILGVIQYYMKYIVATIIVCEVGVEPRLSKYLNGCDGVEYSFVYDENIYFHHTHYRNEMIKKNNTDIIVVCDADIIVSIDQLLKSIDKIRSGCCISLPYDGICYDIFPDIRDLFFKELDISAFSVQGELIKNYGNLCVGGIFVISRNKYTEIGLENEKIIGWGPEDAERLKRASILDSPIHRAKGVIYHLWHPRIKNNNTPNVDNIRQYLHICSLTYDELKSEISSWEWIKS